MEYIRRVGSDVMGTPNIDCGSSRCRIAKAPMNEDRLGTAKLPGNDFSPGRYH